ncbi:MAG TPA: GTPase HflX, partial [Caulobacteraceae bacterium]|nr:GTPase HflX [Caulobacteraceae bacterium]
IDQSDPVAADLGADDGQALAWLYRHGRVVERIDDPDGRTRLSVKLDHQALGRFERLFPGAIVGQAAE